MTDRSLFQKIILTAKATFKTFGKNNCGTLGAALSYYTIFSIAPMMVIVIALAGTFFGRDAVEGRIYTQIDQSVGRESALTIQGVIEKAYEPHNTLVATVISIITLFFGATGLFAQLKHSFNTIFNVYPKPKREYVKYILDRLLSFAFILGIGFVLIVTLVISTMINILSEYIASFFASYSKYILLLLNISISIVILSLLFAAMFKILSDAISRWRDIIIGGFFTALLFMIGELLIGLYLSQSNLSSTYGTAGSILIILVWVNYSSSILFLGACFTYVYAKIFGEPIKPNKFSVALWHHPHPGGD